MTINQHFVDFLARLTPTDAERASYATHKLSIKARLNDSFNVSICNETGSFGNGTGVRFYTDLDLMASIPAASQRNDSQSMLSAVKTSFEGRFTSSSIGIRTPAVVCYFSDNRTVEVTPAYYQEQSNGFSVYLIPDFGGWQKASPSAHNAYVNNINSNLGYKVKPLIRLIKALKYFRNIPISSFYLELRIAKYCQDEESIIYEYDIQRVISRLISDNLAAIRDPMGISGLVSPCTTELQRLDAMSKLNTALTRVNNAVACQKADQHTDALGWWKLVFDREI